MSQVSTVDWWLIAAPASYLIGSLSPSAMVGRIRGVNIQRVGSGNPGATNVGRTLGVRWAVLVAAIDIAKGLVPVLVFTGLAGSVAGQIAGIAAVIGHISSPWLHGHGGKGVATALGAVIGVVPLLAVAVLAAFGIGLMLFKRIGLAACVAAGTMAVLAPLGAYAGMWTWSTAVFAWILAAIVLWRHGRTISTALPQVRT